jgi:MYXO-CTERM domain-containing protein
MWLLVETGNAATGETGLVDTGDTGGAPPIATTPADTSAPLAGGTGAGSLSAAELAGEVGGFSCAQTDGGGLLWLAFAAALFARRRS